jgi:hypothetical protein
VCYILFVRKQFETRVRLVIYMDARDLNRLTARAKREGRVLVAWAREKLMDVLESTPLELDTPKPRKRTKNPPLADGDPTKTESYYHSATSNRLTCLCVTCTEYRRIHDIPLGGLKRAKK